MPLDVKCSVYERSADGKIVVKKTRTFNEPGCEITVQIDNKEFMLTTEEAKDLASLLNKIETNACEFPDGIEEHCWRFRKHYDP